MSRATKTKRKRGYRDREQTRGPITEWVNAAFDGNVKAAAAALGVPYWMLYRPVKEGRRPGIDLLHTLAQHTKTRIEEWL